MTARHKATLRLERLLQDLAHPSIHSGYRADIENLLEGSLDLGRTLVDTTYSSDAAIERATGLLRSLANIIFHLQRRPSTDAFGIYHLPTSYLYKRVFVTQGEALSYINELAQPRDEYEIVPIRIVSSHAVRPPAIKAHLPSDTQIPVNLPGGVLIVDPIEEPQDDNTSPATSPSSSSSERAEPSTP